METNLQKLRLQSTQITSEEIQNSFVRLFQWSSIEDFFFRILTTFAFPCLRSQGSKHFKTVLFQITVDLFQTFAFYLNCPHKRTKIVGFFLNISSYFYDTLQFYCYLKWAKLAGPIGELANVL